MMYTTKCRAAAYYVPLRSPCYSMMVSSRMYHVFSRGSTDQLIFDFGSDYEPLIEFGSIAVSKMINEKDAALLRRATAHLDSKLRRIIREDFDFVVSNDIRCHPLRRSAIEIAHKLLADFGSGGGKEHFRGSFRNTWNDLLILASAFDQGELLWTKDSQLNRVAAGRYGQFKEVQGGLTIESDFSGFTNKEEKESKQYINKSWKVFMRNHGRQSW